MEESQKYLDPKTLSKIGQLDLKARLIVEGFISGLHRSPYRGFSVEFAEHREYVPGDDLRHLDWKVYAKSDRHYIKQYEEETNLRCFLLLDVSESMSFASEDISKLEYGSYMAASLAYLITQQRDAAGLTLFDRAIQRNLPTRTHPTHLKQILHELGEIVPTQTSSMSRIFHELAETFGKRGIVIVISDFFDEPDAILDGLRHFRHRGHEVIVFHVLDAAEVTFPYENLTLFEGLEQLPHLLADPKTVRRNYLEVFGGFLKKIRRGCVNAGMDYVQVKTSDPLGVVLSTYLSAREGGKR